MPPMPLSRMTLVTVVAERLIAPRIARELRDLGARGVTTTDVHGDGTRGVHASEWEGPNVKIETVVPDDIGEAMVAHIAALYFTHHAVIVYRHAVDVVRSEKYS